MRHSGDDLGHPHCSVDDAEAIGRVLADAFENDPAILWCFADPGVRPRRLEATFGLIESDAYVPVGGSRTGATVSQADTVKAEID